uniref:Uncharacterized protein n=1 Tax=Zea mays TaxID=4577 RepID=C4J3X5_MAIZE|nr:unknown [Zea mays]
MANWPRSQVVSDTRRSWAAAISLTSPSLDRTQRDVTAPPPPRAQPTSHRNSPSPSSLNALHSCFGSVTTPSASLTSFLGWSGDSSANFPVSGSRSPENLAAAASVVSHCPITSATSSFSPAANGVSPTAQPPSCSPSRNGPYHCSAKTLSPRSRASLPSATVCTTRTLPASSAGASGRTTQCSTSSTSAGPLGHAAT